MKEQISMKQVIVAIMSVEQSARYAWIHLTLLPCVGPLPISPMTLTLQFVNQTHFLPFHYSLVSQHQHLISNQLQSLMSLWLSANEVWQTLE